jgi:hypothetical protein
VAAWSQKVLALRDCLNVFTKALDFGFYLTIVSASHKEGCRPWSGDDQLFDEPILLTPNRLCETSPLCPILTIVSSFFGTGDGETLTFVRHS